MSGIKPLKKLVSRARDLRDGHRARHSPTGFGFAFADSVEYLDAARWDALTTGGSIFLSRPYLRVLEEAGPESLRQRYAMVFRGREAVAAVTAQCVTVSAARVRKAGGGERLAAALERVRERVLVCGNLLSWGQHGVAFAKGEDPAALWPAVAEALYRLRRADKLSGDADLVMVKDIPAEQAGADELSKFSYHQLETDPDMVLEIPTRWGSYEDYLGSLNAKYRKAARQIEKDVAAAGCRVEELRDVGRHAEELHGLYMQTHRNARLRLVTLPAAYLPALAERLGVGMRCTVVRRDEQLLGFVTTLRDGETAVGYYIGFDREANAEFPVYLRLLQSVVADAVGMGCRRLSLGRTALEPKARLGARPAPMSVWIRHRVPALNVAVRGLLRAVPHDEAPERNPFK
jgi:hypothetical protein